MKKGIVVLSLVIAMLGTFFNIPPVAKAALVKKEVFNQKFNADSFTDENSPWITFLEGWSTTDSPEYPDSPLRDGSTHVAMFNSFDLESGEIALFQTKEQFDLTNVKEVELSWYMYHDTMDDEFVYDEYDEYEEYIFQDAVTPHYSGEKTSGLFSEDSVVFRNDGSEGWKKHSYTFTVPSNNTEKFSFGLTGISDYGLNIYIDEVSISFTTEVPDTTITPPNNQQPANTSKTPNTVVRDKTKPVISAKSGSKKIKNGAKSKKKVKVTVKDNNIKSIKVLYKKKTTTFKKSKTFKKKGTYKITAVDKAGNKATFKFTIK